MSSQRFTRAMRLVKNRDFQAVYEEGYRFRGPNLFVVGRKNGLENTRLGISVAKKKLRRAVDRNHFKRLIREAFRLNREKLPQGVDLVVAPQRGDTSLTLKTLVEELLALGDQARKKLGVKP